MIISKARAMNISCGLILLCLVDAVVAHGHHHHHHDHHHHLHHDHHHHHHLHHLEHVKEDANSSRVTRGQIFHIDRRGTGLFNRVHHDSKSQQEKMDFEKLLEHGTKRWNSQARNHRRRLQQNNKQETQNLRSLLAGDDCIGCIEIETYFTIFTHQRGYSALPFASSFSTVTRTIAQRQFDVLQNAFAGSPFRFVLKRSPQFIRNDEFFLEINSEDRLNRLGSTYRRGGVQTLNVFFGNILNGGSIAFFPQVPVKGKAVLSRDSVVIDLLTMPGVDNTPNANANQGKSIVQAVGHWLGLYNTFEWHMDRWSPFGENRCDPSNPNDFVSDTPQHVLRLDPSTQIPRFDCPSSPPNSCPSISSESDPINNFMDYSSDACYKEFTRGQFDRMFMIWQLFRSQQTSCGSGEALFELELTSDGRSGDIEWNLDSTDGVVNVDDASLDFGQLFAYDTLRNGQVLCHNFCIEENRDYVFTISNSNAPVNGKYSIKIDGQTLRPTSGTGGAQTFDIPRSRSQPTPSPTPAPGPSGGGGGLFCFSGETTVQVKDERKTISMADLEVGDQVLVKDNVYERVYSWGHRKTDLKAKFLQILPSRLELSENHMVFVENRGPIPASMLQVGDRLVSGNGNAVVVQEIRSIVQTGVYTPFTPSGTIVVNGIQASNYVSLQDGRATLTLGDKIKTPFSFHWLDHSFQTVHRLWCHWLQMRDGTMLESGFSTWSEPPYRVASWFLEQNALVMGLLAIPFVMALGVLNILESVLLYPLTFFIIAVGTTLVLFGRNNRRKRLC